MKRGAFLLFVMSLILLSGCTVNTDNAFKSKLVKQRKTSEEETPVAETADIEAETVIEDSPQAPVPESKEVKPLTEFIEEEILDGDEFNITPSDFVKTGTIEKTKLYDDNNVVITANALNYQDYSFDVDLTIDNNSDKKLRFLAETTGYSVNAVNGCMIENGYLLLDVEPGSSDNGTISFTYEELILQGISEVADIQIGFEIEDDEFNSFYTGPLHIKTSLAEGYDYSNTNYHKVINSKAAQMAYGFEIKQFSEDIVYDSNGVSILSEAYLANKDGGGSLMIEVKNDTGKTISFNISDLKANDIDIYEGIWSVDYITPENRMIIAIALNRVLDAEEWEQKGITEIESIGMNIEVKDSESNPVTEPAYITINVK